MAMNIGLKMGGGVTLEGTAEANDVVSGKTFYNTDAGEIQTGTLAQTDTYTYASDSTGGTIDMGVQNRYRYVNASNVYTAGKGAGTYHLAGTKVASAGSSYSGSYTAPANCLCVVCAGNNGGSMTVKRAGTSMGISNTGTSFFNGKFQYSAFTCTKGQTVAVSASNSDSGYNFAIVGWVY